LTRIESATGHRFRGRQLLVQALTHRSYVNEGPPGTTDNERLEFLGDAVIGFIVSSLLVEWFPSAREGELSKLRASLVGEPSLARVAAELDLGESLVLGKGEEKSGGRTRPSILADGFEALVAAIYLDAGIEAADRFVRKIFIPLLDGTVRKRFSDPKTELQELVQARFGSVPQYSVVEVSGPDHAPCYTVSVSVEGEAAALGNGPNRRAAEQEAARGALEKIGGAVR